MAFRGVVTDEVSAKKEPKQMRIKRRKGLEGLRHQQTCKGEEKKCVKRSPVNEARAAAVEFPTVSWSKSTVGKTKH